MEQGQITLGCRMETSVGAVSHMESMAKFKMMNALSSVLDIQAINVAAILFQEFSKRQLEVSHVLPLFSLALHISLIQFFLLFPFIKLFQSFCWYSYCFLCFFQ